MLVDGKLNSESCQSFVTKKNIPLNNCQNWSPHFSLPESKNSTFYYIIDCDPPSFNTARKIHQIQTTWVACFPLCVGRTLSIPWCCCLSLPVSILLPVLYICLYRNIGLYSHDSGILCCDLTLIRANGCMRIPSSHFYCKWRKIVDGVEKRAGHDFGLRISLWKCELAYYWNRNVTAAVKGHKDTTEMCELQAANWCCISTGAPFKR